ncbi:MAG: phage tail tape measure protein [FCB group bacterium]|nr:phage tail tape measure protein [FCB group bacterium]
MSSDVEVTIRIQANEAVSAAFQRAKKAGKDAAQKVTKHWDRASKTLKRAGDITKNIGMQFSKVSIPVAAFGVAAVSAAAKFEQAMGNASTLIKNNFGPTMDELSAGVLKLAESMPKSVDDLGGGIYPILSAGFKKASDAMLVLEASGKLAVAGLSSTEEASTILTVALNAYNKTAEDAAAYSDIVFKTVDAGMTTVADLAVNFGAAAKAATAANISFDDLMAATAALTSVSGKTAEEQTALKALFNEVSKEGSTLDTALKKAGSSGKELNKVMSEKGIGAGLIEIQEQLGVTANQFKGMFGSVEAGGAAFSLMTSANESYLETLDNMRNGANAINLAFEKNSTTSLALWQILKNNLNVAMIELGNRILPILLPVIKKVIIGVQWLTNAFTDLPKSAQTAIIAFGAVVAALGPVLVIAGTIAAAIGAAMPVLTMVTASVVGAAAVIAAKIVGIGLVVTGLVMLWRKNFGGIRDITMQTVDLISGIIQGWIPALRAVWDTISADAERAFLSLWETIGPIVESIGEIFEEVMPHIPVVIATALDTLATIFSAAFAVLYPLISTSVEGWLLIFKYALEGIIWVVSTAIDGWVMIFELGFAALNAIINYVQQWEPQIRLALEALKLMFSAAMDSMKQIIADKDWKGAGIGLAKALARGVMAGAEFLYTNVRNMVQKARDLLPGSDAKTGPLSDLTKSGSGLPITMAAGVAGSTMVLVNQVSASMLAVQMEAERVLDETGSKLTKQQLEQEARRAAELVNQRRFDNQTKLDQLHEQAAAEFAIALKHNQDTSELETYWKNKIRTEHQRIIDEGVQARKDAAAEELRIAEETAKKEMEIMQKRSDMASTMQQAFTDLYEASGEEMKALFYLAKAAGIAEAIISAELGAAKALVAFPGPMGLVFAGIIKAAGYANAAVIASTALEMAEGGIVDSPTFAMVGEAGPEAVIPLSPESLNRYGLGGNGDNGSGGDTIHIHFHVEGGMWVDDPAKVQQLYRDHAPIIQKALDRNQ